jgi:hypothetical protein
VIQQDAINAQLARRFVLEIVSGTDSVRYPVLHRVAEAETQKNLVRSMSKEGREAYWLDSNSHVECGQVLEDDGGLDRPCKPRRNARKSGGKK